MLVDELSVILTVAVAVHCGHAIWLCYLAVLFGHAMWPCYAICTEAGEATRIKRLILRTQDGT